MQTIESKVKTETFKIPVIWEMYGYLQIEAVSLDEAKVKALEDDVPLPEGNYIDGSISLDSEEIIQQMNTPADEDIPDFFPEYTVIK